MADAGYKVGLTVAPIIAAEGWRKAYAGLFAAAGEALAGVEDVTVELITHRYTENSRAVLTSWYPGSKLAMDGEGRMEKRTKFGGVKHVYDKATMTGPARPSWRSGWRPTCRERGCSTGRDPSSPSSLGEGDRAQRGGGAGVAN